MDWNLTAALSNIRNQTAAKIANLSALTVSFMFLVLSLSLLVEHWKYAQWEDSGEDFELMPVLPLVTQMTLGKRHLGISVLLSVWC